MSTTIRIPGHVLDAMRSFAADPNQFTAHSVLSDILLEITSESVRLVATDMHVLGILHLTAMNSYGATIVCVEPASLVLPILELRPLLRDKRDSMLQLTIEGRQVTACNSSGLSLLLLGRDADDYPDYRRIIPGESSTAIAGFSVNALLIARLNAFAKALREEPQYSLRFHVETSLISVYLKNLSAFYGLLAPCTDDGPMAIPTWLTPAPPRLIHLREFDGFSGLDKHGKTWTMFIGESLPEQARRSCASCGQPVTVGWLCLDDGKAVCNAHVTIPVTELG